MMLADGLYVVAVDASLASTQLVNQQWGSSPQLTVVHSRFEDVVILATDVIYSGLALPFSLPACFPSVWEQLLDSLRLGGSLAAHSIWHTLGWSRETDMTFLTRSDVGRLSTGLEVAEIREVEEMRRSASGEVVRAHVFELLLQKGPKLAEGDSGV